jgi:3-phosphoglycerate kinase
MTSDRFVTISFGGGANVVWVNQYWLPGVRADEAHELG